MRSRPQRSSLIELDNGIAILPNFYCRWGANEELVRVLPDWSYKAGHFALVYPAQEFVTPKLRSFIETAEDFFKSC